MYTYLGGLSCAFAPAGVLIYLPKQEFYTARHGVEKSNIEEFEAFMAKLLPRIYEEGSSSSNGAKTLKVDLDPFMVVRMFSFGCINEVIPRGLSECSHRYVIIL